MLFWPVIGRLFFLNKKFDTLRTLSKKEKIMSVAIFDTHAYIKKMKAVGFTEEQAEVQAETVADLINERLVTKADLDLRIAELKTELVKWMMGIALGQVALLVTLLKVGH
jgi:ribosomal protein L29